MGEINNYKKMDRKKRERRDRIEGRKGIGNEDGERKQERKEVSTKGRRNNQ
jgi:hypothetical protein